MPMTDTHEEPINAGNALGYGLYIRQLPKSLGVRLSVPHAIYDLKNDVLEVGGIFAEVKVFTCTLPLFS